MRGRLKPGWSEAVADRLPEVGEAVGAEGGHMFGHPALYAGRKLAVCAYGDGIGVKLPRDDRASGERAWHSVPALR